MYIAALFTIAKIWKETKVDKTSMVHLYNGILLSHKKEKERERNLSVWLPLMHPLHWGPGLQPKLVP